MDGQRPGMVRYDASLEPEQLRRALVLHDRAQGRQTVLVRATAALCITCGLFGATGLTVGVWQASKRPIEAFVVVSDTLGRVPEIRPLGGEFTPSRAMVADRLRTWIVNVRRRPADLVVLRQQWAEVMAMTTGDARSWLVSYVEAGRILDAENADKVAAEFTSAQQLSDGTWLVRWRETVWRQDQQIGPSDWSAVVSTRVIAPRNTSELARNPLGLFVTAVQWSPEGVAQ